MIEKLIEYSVRNPLIIVILALAVAGWGVHSLVNTPIDAIPDLSENQVIVFADWMGRSPQEVEDQVTYPLSVNLQGLAGVRDIRATSEFGFSMINIIFEDHVDFYFARDRVLEKLSTAATFLPPGVTAYMAPDTTALGQIFWYTVEGAGYDLGRLRAIQDWYVRYQLYSVPGVAEVASVGGFPIEYQIDVDPNKLRAYDVTLGELYSAVARSNLSVGGRVIEKGRSEFLVRSKGWIESLEDIENVVIKAVNGVPVTVAQVAAVQHGPAIRRGALEKNGNEAVGGVVLMRYGENPLQVTERIKDKIAQLQPGLPEGVRIVPFYDRTRLIHSAIDTVTGVVKEELFVASAAVLLILWHVRSALIVCLTLPMAILMSFIMMRWFGIPSNIMSLSGIAISIGVLIDSAIVMVDSATHHLYRRHGENRIRGDTIDVVLPAMKTVGRPIFFSVMIMLISFIPVFALGGREGRMFHPLAFTKTFAMIGVAVLAVTLVPALVPMLIKGRVRGEHESWLVRSVMEIYRPVLRFLLEHPWPIVWITGAIFITAMAAVPPSEAPWWFLFAMNLILLVILVWSLWREFGSEEENGTWQAIVWGVLLAGALIAWLAWGAVESRGPIFGPDGLFSWRRPEGTLASTQGLAWLLRTVAGVAGLAVSCLVIVVFAARTLAWWGVRRTAIMAGLLAFALVVEQRMTPVGREFMPPLNEGTLLDMPVTTPRASITQVADDLKARDALLRAFPEVESVVGKAGRAETPTDPSPIDMVETIVNLRPRPHWPRREMRYDDALGQSRAVLDEMVSRGWIAVSEKDQRDKLLNDATMHAVERFDRLMRRLAHREFAAFEQALAPRLTQFAVEQTVRLLRESRRLDREPLPEELPAIAEALAGRFGPPLVEAPDLALVRELAQHTAQALAERGVVTPDPDLLVLRRNPVRQALRTAAEVLGGERRTFHTELLSAVEKERDRLWTERVRELNWELFDRGIPYFTGQAVERLRKEAEEAKLWQGTPSEEDLRALRGALHEPFADRVFLWRKDWQGLEKEMESTIQVPGWANIWTQPIVNRINMLATGVRTLVGVKVFGDSLEQIQEVSQEIARVLEGVRGAVGIVPDQIVGEGYLEIDIDREKAARYGINVGDIQDVIETALGGKVITMTVEGRERFPVRIRYARDFREDEESVRNLLVSAAGGMARGPAMGDGPAPASSRTATAQIPLSQVADVRIVEGPSMIKSENGLLRAYVQLNVRDRDLIGFVEEAQRAVADQVPLPPGMYIEWAGEFEHQARAQRTLSVILPVVVLIIFVILYVTYHDLADALLMMLAVPGAIAGGILFLYLFGHNFSVAVWVGIIACLGLATESGVVMLVYLREAIADKGGLENIETDEELRDAVMQGAVHRLRPKLLTEATTIIGLAPMIWATGTGAEFMQPMAAPVLGGVLVADEVIDLLLPVLFYRVRRRRWERIQRERAAIAKSQP